MISNMKKYSQMLFKITVYIYVPYMTVYVLYTYYSMTDELVSQFADFSGHIVNQSMVTISIVKMNTFY